MTLTCFCLRRTPALVLAVATMFATGSRAADGEEAAFLAENNAAMERMMAGMENQPTGNVDHDFVAMMIPHHQGAIEMAQAELRYGKNEQLRRIAQEIIVDQQQEIAAMRLALGQPLPPSAPVPTQPGNVSSGPARPPASDPHSSASHPSAPGTHPSMSMPMDMSHHSHE